MQLPGLALLNVMTVLAAIGNISRFPTDKQLVSYGSLAPGAHDSDESHQDGHLSKQGRRDLRRVLIETTWSAVNAHPYWKREFARLCRHKPEGVAIARTLLVVIWHVLTERAADCHAEPAMVASKLMRWSWQLTDEQRGGLTSRQFVRYGLLHLRLGNNIWRRREGRGASHDRLAGRERNGTRILRHRDLTMQLIGRPPPQFHNCLLGSFAFCCCLA